MEYVIVCPDLYGYVGYGNTWSRAFDESGNAPAVKRYDTRIEARCALRRIPTTEAKRSKLRVFAFSAFRAAVEEERTFASTNRSAS